jgi:hypothetical protein
VGGEPLCWLVRWAGALPGRSPRDTWRAVMCRYACQGIFVLSFGWSLSACGPRPVANVGTRQGSGAVLPSPAPTATGTPHSLATPLFPVVRPTSVATAQSTPTTGAISPIVQPFPTAADLADALPGGGTIHEGPFVFYAAFYHDAAMQSAATATSPAVTSDIPGLGVRLVWQYGGLRMQGHIQEAWGPQGRVQDVVGYTALASGERGGRDAGGVLLPTNAYAGQRTWFGLLLTMPGQQYGVKIEYTLQANGGGLAPATIHVVPFPAGGTAYR